MADYFAKHGLEEKLSALVNELVPSLLRLLVLEAEEKRATATAQQWAWLQRQLRCWHRRAARRRGRQRGAVAFLFAVAALRAFRRWRKRARCAALHRTASFVGYRAACANAWAAWTRRSARRPPERTGTRDAVRARCLI